MIIFRTLLPFITPSGKAVVENLDSLFFKTETSNRRIAEELNSSSNIDIPLFDPNSISVEFLIDIGIRKPVAQNWYNYLSKGGSFSKPEEIGKIYGLDSATVRRLVPFIKITKQIERTVLLTDNFLEQKTKSYSIDLNRTDSAQLIQLGWNSTMIDSIMVWKKSAWVSHRYHSSTLLQWNIDSLMAMKALMTPRYKKKTDDSFTIEINSADTSEWMLLKGIGTVISRQIVSYRRQLGGYASIEQLLEIELVSPVLFNDIKLHLTVDSSLIEPININTASVRRLRNHPYLDFYKAQAIVEHRKKEKFVSIDQVLNLEPFSNVQWETVSPYLSVGNLKIKKHEDN
ncbi:MAG: helix-hairpin-helix domain-containing protein [Cytophagaceae bacterium]|nr:helix-hairpin-helix domain-containing protein [Cytophagaceae bacterium]